MMIYANQLNLASGEADVTNGLVAVNLAQDWWEMEAALVEGCCQSIDTFTTTANQESTAWPAALRRIDELWRLDSDGNQVVQLDPVQIAGGHTPSHGWPLNVLSLAGSTHTGAPLEYYAKGELLPIFWMPKPDDVYTIRGYGLWAADDYTAAANTFGYPDTVALAIAPFAAKVMQIGLDRELSAVEAEARQAFARAIRLMMNQTRTGPKSRVYSETHDT